MNDVDILDVLNDILIDVLDIEDVTNFSVTIDSLTSDFKNWDSLAHINIIVQLEAHYGIRFSLDEVESFSTIRDIIQIISSKI